MGITPHMTPAELRAALDELDIGQTDLARHLGAHKATSQRWVKDGGQVPGPVAVLIKLLLQLPALKLVIGMERASTKGRKPRRIIGRSQKP